MPDSNNNWIAFVLLLATVAGAGFWYWHKQEAVEPTTEQRQPAEPAATDDERVGPRYPLTTRVESPDDLVDLPSLADSDAYFRIALADLFGQSLDAMLVESGGIERFVTTIDNLPRGTLAERLRPVQAVSGALSVKQVGEDTFELSPANYERYVAYVEMFEKADLDLVIATYRRFYPLLQEAYGELGYPDAYFNDRLIEVIDHLLQTPEVPQPLVLMRPHVLYKFADPDLEELSSGQKIMLRIGPANAERIKRRLTTLRNRLTSQSTGAAD